MNPQLQEILHNITTRLTKLEQAEKQQALDKKADNARELGLDYEPEPDSWRNAAIRLGEELSSIGPDRYYDMTAKQWLDWALDQQPRGKNSLLASQQAEKQEPVAYLDQRMGWAYSVDEIDDGEYDGFIPLYTAPPRKEWVGLTKEEIIGHTCECVDDGTFDMNCAIDFANALQETLKRYNT